MDEEKEVPFSVLMGETLVKVRKIADEEIIFTLADGRKFRMYGEIDTDYSQRKYIESITGDLDDLLNTPILLAEESSSEEVEGKYGIQKWTFYKLATIKGYVDIRWNCTSANEYYSVTVSFIEE